MILDQASFGTTAEGRKVDLFTLSHGGLQMKLTNFGGRITQLLVPDRDGKEQTVVLGFDNLNSYLGDVRFFGSIVGRVANRIAGGKITVAGKEYSLPINDGAGRQNTLHGGLKGFDKVVWDANPKDSPRGPSVVLTYLSPDGDQGLPGNLRATATYTLLDHARLHVEYRATTDRTTVVNLSNHTYFNLAGAGVGTILDQALTLHADKYTPTNDNLIPTGEIKPVRGTPLDFTKPNPIGSRIGDLPKPGYDHNFVLNSDYLVGVDEAAMVLAARVHDPKSGRVMEIMTTQPAIQFYSGTYLDGSIHGIGGAYNKYSALALEPQHFPDSPHHPNFPSIALEPGQEYRHVCIYRFSIA